MTGRVQLRWAVCARLVTDYRVLRDAFRASSSRLCGIASVYKILVVGPSWVGDTVLAQPLFKRLHEKHRELKLDVLAPAWTLPLLAAHAGGERGASPARSGTAS